MSSTAFIAAIVAAVVGPIVAWFTAQRKQSGRVNTSEAQTLWEESQKIRDEYRERQERLEERIVTVEEYSRQLVLENLQLKHEKVVLGGQAKHLQDRVEQLVRENLMLKNTIRKSIGLMPELPMPEATEE